MRATTKKNQEEISEKTKLQRVVPAILMVSTAVVVATLGWFAYKERQQPVDMASLPVIKADPTPMKKKPEDPGGMEIPNRDKQVYSVISGEEIAQAAPAAKAPEELIPPAEEPIARDLLKEAAGDNASVDRPLPGLPDIPEPEEPIGLDEEEYVVTETAGNAQKTANEAEKALNQAVTDIPMPVEPAPIKKEVTQETVKTPAEEAEEAKAPVKELAKVEAPTPAPAVKQESIQKAETEPAKKPEPKPAPVKKAELVPAPPVEVKKVEVIKPKAEPEVKLVAKTENKPAVKTEVADAPLNIQTLPASMARKGFKVQLGSFRDMASLRTGWNNIQKRHPKQMGGLVQTVEKIVLPGKGTFYRLQAGFIAREADARQLCKALISRKQGCLVVRPK
ncbi:MAG: SPOR domain-containing protein [Rickettsiales bacterium]|nr:SPOR domain-containing protein [Rickettsiales bacterium]